MGLSGSTRRDFLKQTAMTVASVATAPSSVAKLIDPKAILADKNHPAHQYFESLMKLVMNRVNLPGYVAFAFNREFAKAKRGALDSGNIINDFLGDKPHSKFGGILRGGDSVGSSDSDNVVSHKLITDILQNDGFYFGVFSDYFKKQLKHHPKYKDFLEKKDSLEKEREEVQKKLRASLDKDEINELYRQDIRLFKEISLLNDSEIHSEFSEVIREKANQLKRSASPEFEISKIMSGLRRSLINELGLDGFQDVLGKLFSEYSTGTSSKWIADNHYLKGCLSRVHEESNVFDKVPDEFLSLAQRFKVTTDWETEFVGDNFLVDSHHRNRAKEIQSLREKGLMPDLEVIKEIALDPTGEALGRFITNAFKNVFAIASEYNQVAKAAFSTINNSIIETNRKELTESLKNSFERWKQNAKYPKLLGRNISEYVTVKSNTVNPLVFVINIKPEALKDGVSKQTYARVLYKMLIDLKIDGLELTKPKNTEGRMFARVASGSDAFVMLEEVEFKYADTVRRVSHSQARLQFDKVITESSTEQENEQAAFEAFSKELMQRGSFLKYVNPREEAKSIVSDVMNYRGYSYSR